ncbi:glycoside hydrolase family 30 beta sandwich domain-containing protein [Rubrolithibacter danxiaensis]|uniref:glycoside hydrolase family 30 beta sandwich domain-containing protein n=1 Tax=Rubrolithibacter danxiaensis TaxID=3390805 RepID=UPI003BF90F9A
MILKNSVCIVIAGLAFFNSCKKSAVKNESGTSSFDITTRIEINRAEKYQSIDGFGFFGAQDVWWEQDQSKLYSEAWAKQVINDLGITIWRNEYHPPATPAQNQDSNWEKDKPVVEGLAKVARENKVPLKVIFTIWSPPAELKCAVDTNTNEPISGTPHPYGTIKGGTLDPAKYTQFANWLADGIQLYKNSGVDVYAISPQNEPLFVEPYNSCVYKPQKWYSQMLKNVVPVVKARFPNVKIFGSENMLEMEGGTDRQWFYGADIMKDPEALSMLDIWALHGYLEGIKPTESSKVAGLWQTVRTEYAEPSNKPVWMTETSGYGNNWTKIGDKPGALDLGMDILAALYYGKISGWVWWQGSGGDEDYSLMNGMQAGKKYYTSKHFYRFIRPGSRMIKLTFNNADKVSGVAFENENMGSFTVVLINPTNKKVKVNLTGADIPEEFDFYYTTASDNCKKKEKKVKKDEIILPALSMVTLVNGNVFE